MYSGPAVPATHLGLGVHPYGYNSSGGYWWRNEYRKTDALGRRIRPGTSCSNIDILTRTWSGTGKDYAPPTSRYSGKTYDFLQHGSVGSLPLVFTEDNYSTGERAAAGPIDPKTNKPTVIAVNNAQAEGAYIADLFTWVYNHVCGRSKGQCNRSIGIDPGKSRLRVGIWRGVNKGDDKLGMYYSGSEVPPTNPLTDVYYRKYANLSVCPQARNIASGGQSIPHIYASLINAACYH